MTVFETFDGLEVKNALARAFSDVEVTDVKASKSKKLVTVVLSSNHLIEYNDLKDMEAEMDCQFFKKMGMRSCLQVVYSLSSHYSPEAVWDVYKGSLMAELSATSSMNAAFLDNSNVYFEKDENGVSSLVIEAEDNFIYQEISKEIALFLRQIFAERFHTDLIIKNVWLEPQQREFKEPEVYSWDSMPKTKEESRENKERKVFSAEKATVVGGQEETGEKANEKAKDLKEKAATANNVSRNTNNDKFVKKTFKAGFNKVKLEDCPDLFYGNPYDFSEKPTPIMEIEEGFSPIVIRGKVLKVDDPKQTKKGDKYIIKFAVTDLSDSIYAKLFIPTDDKDEFMGYIKAGNCVEVCGIPEYDTFDKEMEISRITGIKSIPEITKKRKDNAEVKRVELHAHTMMSEMDAVIDPGVLVKTAFNWGMPAVAITDHGVVQGYTDAYHTLQKLQGDKNEEIKARAKAFKIIYGCEIYLVDDEVDVVAREKGQIFTDDCVVFDIETTGFNRKTDKIIEIGAVKIEGGKVTERFSEFINPEMPIPPRIVSLTHITDDMVKDAETIDKVLPRFLAFVGDRFVVGHNVKFDAGFIEEKSRQLGYSFSNSWVDTVGISRSVLSGLRNYKLDTVAAELGVKLDGHHRAVNDAECTMEIYLKLCAILDKRDIYTLAEAHARLKPSDEAIRNMHPYHCIVLCKNDTGRVNLYKMVSASHLRYYKQRPKVPKSMLRDMHEGIIIGSACEQGELFKAILEDAEPDRIASLCEFYDYYEIQPLGNNRFMIDEEKITEVTGEKDLIRLNQRIVELGEQYDKPVVATCDSHFLNPEDEVYRRLMMHSKGFKDADNQAPLFFRTTEEMLEEFQYLGSKKAKEVVIDNTLAICRQIDKIEPVRPDKAPPVIDHAEETLAQICHDKAHSMYGEQLPKVVEDRLERELTSIIKNGYAVMYIIAQKLVWKSNEDGYLVGSRGSVGSSFVATMSGITEINPLPAHYYCPECHYADFDSDFVRPYQKNAICGFDMPDRDCPVCGHKLIKDGCDIPFETFLGFNCDKEPDIDLNFSGEYQSKAHDYTEVIFGKGQTFKAGTVQGVADKTALGYALKYDEDHHNGSRTKRIVELERQSMGCIGVRRSTGQHPGGIVVLPVGEDIDTFTPVQRPANDVTSNVTTTHFDYHSIDHNLLKLDILGHDDPTMIKRLEELTGIDAKTIPMDDKKVVSLFHGTEAMGITKEDLDGIDMGSLGLPELGTDNAMNMLRETKPDCFSDMVRISGLSHGTDVYANNAQVLIAEGTCTLKNAICTRDDIMLYLINQNVEPGHAFKIMESVRKGKGLTEDWEKEMKDHGVPDWYIWSCKKIQYMFPKAHACAYIMMAFRVAWFKVYHPLAYYAAFFGIRAAAFDYETMCLGKDALKRNMEAIKEKVKNHQATAKEETSYMNMKSVLEMYARGLEFMPIDIFVAKPHSFQIIDGKLMPALDTIEGLGEKAADLVFEACKGGPFTSKENFKLRSKATQSAIDTMARLGILGNLPDTDQMSLMDLFDL